MGGWGEWAWFPEMVLGRYFRGCARVIRVEVRGAEEFASCCGVNLGVPGFWGWFFLEAGGISGRSCRWAVGAVGGGFGLSGLGRFPELVLGGRYFRGCGRVIWVEVRGAEEFASCCGVNLAVSGFCGGGWGQLGWRHHCGSG